MNEAKIVDPFKFREESVAITIYVEVTEAQNRSLPVGVCCTPWVCRGQCLFVLPEMNETSFHHRQMADRSKKKQEYRLSMWN